VSETVVTVSVEAVTTCEATYRWVPSHSTSASVLRRSSICTRVSTHCWVFRSSRKMCQVPDLVSNMSAHQVFWAYHSLLCGLSEVGTFVTPL
jgi:hypothetical protein